jgi:hypothetical protein
VNDSRKAAISARSRLAELSVGGGLARVVIELGPSFGDRWHAEEQRRVPDGAQTVRAPVPCARRRHPILCRGSERTHSPEYPDNAIQHLVDWPPQASYTCWFGGKWGDLSDVKALQEHAKKVGVTFGTAGNAKSGIH